MESTFSCPLFKRGCTGARNKKREIADLSLSSDEIFNRFDGSQIRKFLRFASVQCLPCVLQLHRILDDSPKRLIIIDLRRKRSIIDIPVRSRRVEPDDAELEQMEKKKCATSREIYKLLYLKLPVITKNERSLKHRSN